MRIAVIGGLIVAAAICKGADVSGDWVAEVTLKTADPQYARVRLEVDHSKLTGTWEQMTVEGTISDERVNLSLVRNQKTAFTLMGELVGTIVSGVGQMNALGSGAGKTQAVTWRLTRPEAPPPVGPKTFDFEPSQFNGYFTASYQPTLHVFPGDTIRTRTFDGSGRDADRRGPGSNPETGPFFVEGALPGDTLIVKLKKLRINRDSAVQGNHIHGRAVTPAYVASASYNPQFNSEWKLDRPHGIATLANPTDRLKRFRVPIFPMLGCIATAPPGSQSRRANELGPYGGNMDYNQMVEGTTLYLPVFHPGALLTIGDGHAAMGDGELTTSALETSLDVEFSVDVIQGHATAFPRLENDQYLMSMGIAGSIEESIQFATAELADWLKGQYGLDDNEVAVLLGAVIKYDIAELVDPQFNVVAKVPKTALSAFQ